MTEVGVTNYVWVCSHIVKITAVCSCSYLAKLPKFSYIMGDFNRSQKLSPS